MFSVLGWREAATSNSKSKLTFGVVIVIIRIAHSQPSISSRLGRLQASYSP